MSTSDGSSADYYVLPPDSKQLQDLISHRDMNAQMGEIFRACYRYGLASHSGKMRDARKIKFYIEAEIARLEKLGDTVTGESAGEPKVKMPGGCIACGDPKGHSGLTCPAYKVQALASPTCIHPLVPVGAYCNECKAYKYEVKVELNK